MTVPGNRARGAIRVTGWLLVASAVMVLAFLAVGPHVFGYRTMTVRTASMRPTMPPGSVAMIVETPVERIVVGDVITFRDESGETVTHRIVASVITGREPVVQTQGDANNAADTDLLTLRGSVWRVRAVVPYLGFAIAWARSTGVADIALTWGPWLVALVLVVDVWRPRRAEVRPGGGGDTSAARPAGVPSPAGGLSPVSAVRIAATVAAMGWVAVDARRRDRRRPHHVLGRG